MVGENESLGEGSWEGGRPSGRVIDVCSDTATEPSGLQHLRKLACPCGFLREYYPPVPTGRKILGNVDRTWVFAGWLVRVLGERTQSWVQPSKSGRLKQEEYAVLIYPFILLPAPVVSGGAAYGTEMLGWWRPIWGMSFRLLVMASRSWFPHSWRNAEIGAASAPRSSTKYGAEQSQHDCPSVFWPYLSRWRSRG